jgi:hypothetical protein
MYLQRRVSERKVDADFVSYTNQTAWYSCHCVSTAYESYASYYYCALRLIAR